MSRLIGFAFVLWFAVGCSTLPDSARDRTLNLGPLRRLAVNNKPIPLETETVQSLADLSKPDASRKRSNPWSPDDLIVGSGIREKVATQQLANMQRWDSEFTANSSAEQPLVPETVADLATEPAQQCSMITLRPLPEPAPSPSDCSTAVESAGAGVVAHAIDRAPPAPSLEVPPQEPADRSVYVLAAMAGNTFGKHSDSPRESPEPFADASTSANDADIDQLLSTIRTANRLHLSRVCICQQVDGLGQLVEFPSATFAPDDQVLIYCEVANFKSETQHSSQHPVYRTRLSGSFVVTNVDGEIVADEEYAAVDDFSQAEREDFFLVFPAKIPNLKPGNYRLYLMVNDELGRDIAGQGQPIQFQIASTAEISR